MGEIATIKLQRFDTTQPWGFKLQGGSEHNAPLHVGQCNPKSVSGHAGLKSGDGIIQICGENVAGWSHEAAKAALIRAGNDIVFVVQRGAVAVKKMKPRPAQAPAAEPRAEICEDSIDPGMNQGSKFRQVNQKTYQVMKEEEQAGGSSPPASIFSRKKQDRSQYLQEDKNTIQKTFGQS